MGQVILTTLVDDIDESEADETIQFGIDGQLWEIDLNEKHTEDLRNALAYFSQFARPVAQPRARKRSKASSNGSAKRNLGAAVDPAAIRGWAVKQGLEVGVRGRLNKGVVDAYLAVH